ncbi:hypothetical protein ACFWP3_20960 [Streptomyces sp. NPDC058525]|uniref:hypothetical protein n=1 Tax=Streptomyces sp. NPDC058525 TaxID=3346538 RepID=UPI00365F8494
MTTSAEQGTWPAPQMTDGSTGCAGTEEAPDLSPDQIGDGLTAVVSVKHDRPEFTGSTRGVLDGDAVRTSVADAVREHLGTWLDGHPEQAAAIVGRIVQGARQN